MAFHLIYNIMIKNKTNIHYFIKYTKLIYNILS